MRVDVEAVGAIIREVSAEIILPRFRHLEKDHIGFKIGDDPVTIADKEAEIALSTRLLDLLPGSKAMGEEGFALNNRLLALISGSTPTWIIDPIDGTRNFVGDNPEFGVIVTLAEQNQLIAGWIYDPTSSEIVTAETGSGAWYKGSKLKTLPPAPLAKMHGFLGDRLMAAYEKTKHGKTSPVFTEMTAGSHEYPRLVLDQPHFGKDKPQGHFRASLYYATPWDDAAGVLIHREAGGYAAFWNGDAYNPSVMHKGLALAPDKDSWHELRNWCRSFAELPA
jgi:fructose-1,6-bisphosphatase/inositol monophosphatase family enzyme